MEIWNWKEGKNNRLRGDFNHQRNDDNKEIAATMFIPPSGGSLLFKHIEEEENKMVGEMSWKIKLIEQSGVPLNLIFIPKFPLSDGCPRGEECSLCENTGIKCNTKGVIYKATCEWCKRGIISGNAHNFTNSLLLQDGSQEH